VNAELLAYESYSVSYLLTKQ